MEMENRAKIGCVSLKLCMQLTVLLNEVQLRRIYLAMLLCCYYQDLCNANIAIMSKSYENLKSLREKIKIGFENALTYNLIKLFGSSVGVSFKPMERQDRISSSTVPEH